MSFRGKHYSTRNEYLYLGRSPSEFFTRGLAHFVDSVGDHRHHVEGTRLTTGIDDLIEGAEVGPPAGLRQGASRVEQSWANDFPFGQKTSDAVVGAAGFPDRSETVH